MYKIHELLNSCLIKDFFIVFVNLFFVLPVFFSRRKKMYDVSATKVFFQLLVTMILHLKSHLKLV